MITFEKGLYVRVQEMEGPRAPMPRPLQSGFVAETAYRVLGLHAPSETSDAYFVLSNDRDEVWFITTRHVRTAVCPKTVLSESFFRGLRIRQPIQHSRSAVPRSAA